MQQFGIQEVARLADIPVPSLRAMVRARYVAPTKGPRGTLRFSFHDLVLLRTARNLLAAGVTRRSVGKALGTVRAQLPCDAPPRGLSVTATAGRVVVHEAGARRDAISGQLLLSFDVCVDAGEIRMIETSGQPADCSSEFAAALQLEDTDVDAALEAYRACVRKHSDSAARANLGRLLHLQGKIREALALYEAAEEPDGDLLFNQGVALEDLDRLDEAIAVYGRVIKINPAHAEAHHNLARLLHLGGEQRLSLRHWSAYRKLSRESQP